MKHLSKANDKPKGKPRKKGNDSREQRLLRQEFGHLSTRVINGLPMKRPGARVIGFCAGHPKEGCTSVATNYAVFCGQQGVRTTLLETVLRRPSLAGYFNQTNEPGLWDFLDGTAEPGEIVRTAVADGLNLVPAGDAPEDMVVAGESFDLTGLLDHLAPHNDLIVVDVPPLTNSPEANLILPQLDGVVLVVQANRSRVCAIERTVHSIQQSGVTVVGSVLNKMRYDLPSIVDRIL